MQLSTAQYVLNSKLVKVLLQNKSGPKEFLDFFLSFAPDLGAETEEKECESVAAVAFDLILLRREKNAFLSGGGGGGGGGGCGRRKLAARLIHEGMGMREKGGRELVTGIHPTIN